MQLARPTVLGPLDPAEVERYFKVVERSYRLAAAARAPADQRSFDLGGYTVQVRGPNATLLHRMTRALAHLEAEPGAPPDLTIHLWDGAAAEAIPPSPLAWYCQQRHGGDLAPLADALFDVRGELPGFTTERIRAAFHVGPNRLQLLDTGRDLGLYWVEDARELPDYEIGAPFARVLSWWMAARGRFVAHAGAVGTPTGGVLLAGPGGVGKSTSALACLGTGLGYAGDDYCLVATEPAPRVYSLYNTAKLDGPVDFERFPQLAPLVENADRLGHEKALMFLHASHARGLTRGFPLRAVLLPTVTDAPVARLRPVSATVALQAMAPSTFRQLPGGGQRTWRLMTRLVRAVPSYRLEVGPDIASIPPLIERLVAQA